MTDAMIRKNGYGHLDDAVLAVIYIFGYVERKIGAEFSTCRTSASVEETTN